MPTAEYSHMAMEIEHMVGGDGLDDDGGEESVKIPLSGMEGRINLTPETKIMVVAALHFAIESIFLAG
jgi:hypothetical protein